MAKTKKLYPKENIVKILLLIIVVWFLTSLAGTQIRGNLIQTEVVNSTVLEHADIGYGLLSGQETVIAASADGAVERTVAEGGRVRKGNAVFNVNGVISYTNDAGRVSYQLDGLEGITDLSAVCSTDLETRYSEQQSVETTEPADAVVGAAYAKVTNIFDDVYVYLTVPRTNYTTTLEVDQRIPIRLTDLDYELQATVTEVLDAMDGTRYLKLELGSVKELVFQQRIYKMELPYDRITAIAIPKEALVEQNGESGVYYLQKGFVFWKPVTIREDQMDQELVVIETGLEDGDIIVTTPRWVHEGENIKY